MSPARLAPGRYKLLVSIGTDDPVGNRPQRITFSADERFGIADGKGALRNRRRDRGRSGTVKRATLLKSE